MHISAPAATGLQSYTGFGFQPKAVIAIATTLTAEGFGAQGRHSVGMATGSAVGAQRVAGYSMSDDVATTVVDRAFESKIISIPDGATGFLLQASLNDLLADGVQLNWVTTISGALCILIGIGGTEVSSAELVPFTMPIVTGNFDILNVGNFQPDAALFLGAMMTVLGRAAVLDHCLGAALSTTKRWALAITAADATNMTAAMNAERRMSNTRCLIGMNNPAVDFEADFVQFLTNGIRVNFIDAPASAWLGACLMVKGSAAGMFDADLFTEAAAVGDQDITTPGFEPSGVLIASALTAAFNAELDAQTSIGAAKNATPIVRGTAWANVEDALLNSQADSRLLSTRGITRNDSLTGGGLSEAEADVTLFLSNGWRNNWTVGADGTTKYGYFAVKKTAGAAALTPPDESWLRKMLLPAVSAHRYLNEQA